MQKLRTFDRLVTSATPRFSSFGWPQDLGGERGAVAEDKPLENWKWNFCAAAELAHFRFLHISRGSVSRPVAVFSPRSGFSHRRCDTGNGCDQ
jgi:hypothetical protein